MLKDRLNSLGAEITNSITFRNYLTWLDNFYTGSANKTDLAKNGIVGRTSQSGAPTPSTPQPINNLSGDVPYKVSGKNKILTNISNWESGQYNSSGYKQDMVSRIRLKELLPIKPNTTYYVDTFDTTGFSLNHVFILRECDANGDFINSIGTVSSTNTFTTRNDTYYLMVTIGTTSTQSGETFTDYQTYFSDEKLKPFICLNSEIDKSYEPYIEPRTFTIPLGNIALNNIDGYVDNIHSENGKFYLYKETGVHILNGSENWTFSNSPSTPTPRTVAYIIHTDSDYSKKYYSNRFVYGDTSTSNRLVLNSNNRWNVSLDNTLTGITSSDTNDQKLEKIKTYISNNNIEVDYVLIASTTTEITGSNYPELYAALKEIQDYLTAYKINKEFILEYSSPEIEY